MWFLFWRKPIARHNILHMPGQRSCHAMCKFVWRSLHNKVIKGMTKFPLNVNYDEKMILEIGPRYLWEVEFWSCMLWEWRLGAGYLRVGIWKHRRSLTCIFCTYIYDHFDTHELIDMGLHCIKMCSLSHSGHSIGLFQALQLIVLVLHGTVD